MDAASFAPHFAHSPSVSLRVVSQGHSIQPRWLSLLGRIFVVAHIACGKTFPSVHFAIWRSTNLLLRLSGQSQHSAQMALMQRVRARRVAMHGNCDRMWLALLGSRQIFSEDILCSVSGAFLVRPVLGRSYSYQHAETKELINLLIVIITQIPASDNVLIWITSTRSINLLRASTSYTSSPSKTLKPIKPIKRIKSIKPFWTFTMRKTHQALPIPSNVRFFRPAFPVALLRWLREHLQATGQLWPSRPHGPRASGPAMHRVYQCDIWGVVSCQGTEHAELNR